MDSRKYKVLVVDDNEAVRALIVKVLSVEGHRCVTAKDGSEAIKATIENSFDAVITDIVMPGMDGITLTRELSKEHEKLPIMILTGHDVQYSPESAIAAGAREFIRKPFSVDEFIIRFRKMMRDHEMACTVEAKKNQIIFTIHTEFAEKIERLEREVGRLRGALPSKYSSCTSFDPVF